MALFGALEQELRLDKSQFSKELSEAEREMESVDDQTQSTGSSFQSMGEKMKGAGMGLSAGVTAPLAAVGFQSLQTASDVEEMQSKMEVVFGESEDEIRQWAATQEEATGISELQWQEYATTLADTFKPMGFAQDEANAMSKEVTGLAVDLASFNNMETTEALDRLRGGLVGNHENLEAFGVMITQANLEEKLEEMFGVGADAATEMQKAQARLQMVTEGTTDAQGDAARTSESWANQVRALKGQLRETGATIGQELMPVMKPLLSRLQGAVTWFSGLSSEVKQTIIVASGLAAALGPVLLTTGLLLSALGGAPAIMASVSSGLGALGGVVTSAGAAVTGFVGTLTSLAGTAVSLGTTLYATIHAALLALPGVVIGAATSLGSVLVSSIVAVKTALLALPGQIATLALSLGSTLVSSVVAVKTALLGLPAQIASMAVSLGTSLVAAAASAATTLAALPGIIAAKTVAMASSITITGLLSGALGGLSAAAGLATGGVAALTAALATIGAPIAIVIAAVVALYTAWKSNFLGIRNLTSGVVTFLKALFTGDFATIKGQVQNVARSARQFWDNNIKPMVATARNAIGTIKSAIIAPFLAWFTPIWQKHLGVIKRELAITAQAWLDTISAFIDWARPYVSAFLSDLSAWWSQHGDQVMAIVRPLLNGLKRLFEMAFSIIADIIVGFIRLARLDFSGFKDSMLSIVDTLASGVVDLFRWLYDKLIGNSIVPEMLSDIISAVKSWNFVSEIKSKVDDALSKVEGFASDFKSAGKDLINSLIDGIDDKIGALEEKAEEIGEKVDKYTPSSDADEGPLSNLTDSGAALPETLAKGMEKNLSTLEGSSTKVAHAANPAMAGGGTAGGGGRGVVINVDARGASNPRETKRRARQGVASALNAYNVQR